MSYLDRGDHQPYSIALHLTNVGKGLPALHVVLVKDAAGAAFERREFTNGYQAEEYARSWGDHLPVTDNRAGLTFRTNRELEELRQAAEAELATDAICDGYNED